MATGFYDATQHDLPHDPIKLATFLIVERALRVAWERLRKQSPAQANIASHNDKEDPVTHALFEIFYDDIFQNGVVPGFNRELFTDVNREGKVRNFNGEEIDKMPDLSVGFVGRDRFKKSQDRLFIECKPIDAGHPVGACYCSKGLIRFIDGRYAWAMREALMLGYASSKYTVIPKLKNALKESALKKKPSNITTLDYPAPCSKSSETEWSEAVYISRHSRSFSYVETGDAAPPITIRHLWLKRY